MLFKKHSYDYALKGAFFGLCFPVLAFLIESRELAVPITEVLSHHPSNLLIIICTAPLFLGSFAYWVGLKQEDIEDLYRKKASEELEQMNAHLTEAELNGKFGSWKWDMASGELVCSEGLYVIFGRSRETSAKSISEFLERIFIEDVHLVQHHIREVQAELSVVQFEFRIRNCREEIRWLKAVLKGHSNMAGAVERVVGTFQDITEIKSHQETILEQQQALVQVAKLSALGEMAGGIAHEINTPLGAILLNAEMVQMQNSLLPVPNAEIEKRVQSIASTVERVGKVILSLRNLSRNSAGEDHSHFTVRELVDGVADLCRERFKNHGTILEINEEGLDLQLKGQMIQLSQVVLNLLSNSFDAIQGLENKKIRIEARSVNDWVQLRVQDSGNGISQHILEKMFQPFFTTKDINKGTGLGLSLSRNIVKSHQGELFYDGSKGGTCFVIQLPASGK